MRSIQGSIGEDGSVIQRQLAKLPRNNIYCAQLRRRTRLACEAAWAERPHGGSWLLLKRIASDCGIKSCKSCFDGASVCLLQPTPQRVKHGAAAEPWTPTVITAQLVPVRDACMGAMP